MGLRDLTRASAVEQAVAEFDALGREAFLAAYGFGKAQSYFVVVDGQEYDSKAIAAAAHGFQFPGDGPLPADSFSGGEATVAKQLEGLGFTVTRPTGAHNPTWTNDELLLALDLYLRRGHVLSKTDPDVLELSDLLNRLPIHTDRPDEARFRNPNGVVLKLANFAALDPAYPGKGMTRVSQRDREVWDEYHDRPDEVRRIAQLLRTGTDGSGFPTTPEEGEDGVEEGRLLFRRHRGRERDPKLVRRKKQQVLRQTGRLACEVCGFDFAAVYGELGEGFIECHHTVPLASSGPTTTRLDDLALLCANCHRMAHRSRPFASMSALRAIVRHRR